MHNLGRSASLVMMLDCDCDGGVDGVSTKLLVMVMVMVPVMVMVMVMVIYQASDLHNYACVKEISVGTIFPRNPGAFLK